MARRSDPNGLLARRVAALGAVVALVTSCTSSGRGEGAITKTNIDWCGQALLPPAYTTFGRLSLTMPNRASNVMVPDKNELPPLSKPTRGYRYSDIVIISKNCHEGATVVVSPMPRGLTTVATSYDTSHHGLTALIFGWKPASRRVAFRVLAYRAHRLIGQARVPV